MNKWIVAAVAVSLCSATGAMASTATWDFEKDATDFREAQKDAGDEFEGTFSQVYSGSSTKGGITLSAEAYLDDNNDGIADNGPDDPAVTPFMDAYSAGLGVCKTGFYEIDNGFGGESRCSTGFPYYGDKNAGDDNLVNPEVLKLIFDQDVDIMELVVRNGSHNLVSGNMLISTDGTFDATTDKYSINGNGEVDLTGLGVASMFWFTSFNDQNVARPEIYLDTLTVSSVPVPAALPLLLAGLGGLGWIGRRRKTA